MYIPCISVVEYNKSVKRMNEAFELLSSQNDKHCLYYQIEWKIRYIIL